MHIIAYRSSCTDVYTEVGRTHGCGYKNDYEHPHESAHLHLVARRIVFAIEGVVVLTGNGTMCSPKVLTCQVLSCRVVSFHAILFHVISCYVM